MSNGKWCDVVANTSLVHSHLGLFTVFYGWEGGQKIKQAHHTSVPSDFAQGNPTPEGGVPVDPIQKYLGAASETENRWKITNWL